MALKRMETLLALGDLPARDPPLARAFIYGKLLAALLLEDLTDRFLDFSPGAIDWSNRPPSLWRIQRVLADGLRFSATGPVCADE